MKIETFKYLFLFELCFMFTNIQNICYNMVALQQIVQANWCHPYDVKNIFMNKSTENFEYNKSYNKYNIIYIILYIYI